MEIKGYKSFNKGLVNRKGKKFQVGKIEHVDGDLVFGNNGNGYHFCANLEDTFRYVPAMEEEIVATEVTSLDDKIPDSILVRDDEYSGYFDLYVARDLRVDRVIPRNEIISIYLNFTDKVVSDDQIKRFISTFKLNEKEIEMFKLRYFDDVHILDFISYYQENDKTAFERRHNMMFIKEKMQ